MSTSAFAHPLLSGLLGDQDVAQLFTPEAEIAAMLDIEVALAAAQAAHREIGGAAAEAIADACQAFKPDIAALGRASRRDGLIAPALIAALRETLPEPHRDALHKGATSQDLVDTCLALRLGHVIDLFIGRLEALEARLADIAAEAGGRDVMGWTRMRAAMPLQFEHRLSAWRRPLAEARIRAGGLRKLVCVLHLGGPVGDRRGIGRDGLGIANHMATALGLGFDPMRRHSSRAWVADTGHWLSLISGALAKIGADVTLMVQDGIEVAKLADGGRSSAMPHKVNPVAAETLVALARFNAVQVAGLHQSLVHEMERSGAAWTLEWMVLPQMAAATGASLKLGRRLLETTDFTDQG